MEENKLIKYDSGQLQKVSTQITITDKLIYAKQRYEVIEFLSVNSDFFYFIIYEHYINEKGNQNPLENSIDYYLWVKSFIDKYSYMIDWDRLSRTFPWSTQFIELYENQWDWSSLSRNISLPWTKTLIETYKDKWCWSGLSRNPSLPWSKKFIDLYQDKWDWSSMSKNSMIPWSEELIEEYKDKWDWIPLSCDSWYMNRKKVVPFTIELIEKYKDFWNWNCLSHNQLLPWSESLIERYKERWSWRTISFNIKIPQKLTFLGKFKENLDWRYSLIRITEINEFNEFYKNNLTLLSNVSISININLPINSSFIEQYKNNITENNPPTFFEYGGISSNLTLPWSVPFILEQFDNLNLEALLKNKSIPWTIEYFNSLKEHLCKIGIGCSKFQENETFNWSIKLIKENIEYLEYRDNDLLHYSLALNKACWKNVFKKFFNDDLIDEVICKIKIRESHKD